MSFGENLQYLRRMHNKMTQEDLAFRLGVARQTVSKWELNQIYPEIDKIKELCKIFKCKSDDLLFGELDIMSGDSYSDISIVTLDAFDYLPYTVISNQPEDDSMKKALEIANSLEIDKPDIVGFDFPFLSQEQINVFHMHGYTAAIILPKNYVIDRSKYFIQTRKKSRYVTLTIYEPFLKPWTTIPNGFKALIQYININGLTNLDKANKFNFERAYNKNGSTHMDIFVEID